MAFFNEFPFTRTYDSDLGWLIRHVGENIENLATLQKWAATHKEEYTDLKKKVDGLIENLVDVIVPWDSSIAYRIFSIVEYQGTNYIAVQDVPIGTMITNTDYWVPANTVVEQINAIGTTTQEIVENTELLKNGMALGYPAPEWNNILTEPTGFFNDTLYGIYRLAGNDYYSSYNVLQGGCYNTNNDRFYMALVNSTFTRGIIVELNSDFTVNRRSAPFDFGHGNSLTFNPTSGNIYIAPGTTGEHAGNVIEFNPVSMTVVNYYPVDILVWSIAYDVDANIFYISDNSAIVKLYDETFTEVGNFELDLKFKGDSERIIVQNIFSYDSLLYAQSFSEEAVNAGYTGVYISSFTKDGESVNSFKRVPFDPAEEPESICVKDGIAYVFCGQGVFRVYRFSLTPYFLTEPNTDYIHGGTPIKNGDDLNTYIRPGKYACINSAMAATLQNMPAVGGYSAFTLLVSNQGWVNIKQELWAAEELTYSRTYYPDRNTWSAWEKHLSTTGKNTATFSVDVPTAASTQIGTIDVPAKKTVLATATITFPSNSEGRRMLSLDGAWRVSQMAVDGDSTRLSATYISYNNSHNSRPTEIRCYQNSGSTLNVTATVDYLII